MLSRTFLGVRRHRDFAAAFGVEVRAEVAFGVEVFAKVLWFTKSFAKVLFDDFEFLFESLGFAKRVAYGRFLLESVA